MALTQEQCLLNFFRKGAALINSRAGLIQVAALNQSFIVLIFYFGIKLNETAYLNYTVKPHSGFVLVWALQIPWLFPWPFQVFHNFSLAVTFKNFQNFPCFRVFFDFKQFNRHKLWCPPKCMPLALFNYSSLYYCILHCPCLIICSNWSIKQNFNLPWLSMTENKIPWLFRPGKWNP